MNETFKQKLSLIFGRRSVRVYSPGDVTAEQVDALLQAGMAAPSAMTKDPWRCVVVHDKAALAELGTILPGGKMLSTASLALVVAGDLEVAFEQHVGYLVQDVSACTQNILLAAHALGLGACWVGVYPSEDSMRRVRSLFGMPGSVLPIAVISLGLPGEQLEPRTRHNPDFVHNEKWRKAS